MSRTNRAFSIATLSPLACALLAVSCSRQHQGPEVGDSVTNWLRSCAREGDCAGDAMCLNAVCSVSCAGAGASACAVLSPDAICDQAVRACDLPCDSEGMCAQLGAGFTCREGRCREQLASASESPVSDLGGPFSPLSVAHDAARDAVWTQGSNELHRTAPPRPGGSAGPARERFALSDPNDLAHDPFVDWDSFAWRVTWWNETPSNAAIAIEMADVSTAEEYTTWLKVYPVPQASRVNKGNDYSIGLSSRADDGTCSIGVAQLISTSANTPTRFACMATAAMAPVPNSDDWLVSWLGESLVSDLEQGLLVARYNPNQVGFSAGPWQLGSNLINAGTGVAVADGNGWAWATTNLYFDLFRLKDIGQQAPYPASQTPIATSLQAPSTGVRQIVAVGTGVLVLDSTAEGFRARAIDAQSDEVRAQKIAPGAVLSVRAVYMDEHQQVAACATTGSHVAVYLLTRDGEPVGRPFSVAALDPGRLVRSCDLDWHDSELLVAWEESDDLPTPLAYNVFARVVSLSAPEFTP